MFGLSRITTAIGGGLAIALLLVTAWGMRVDHLRGQYRAMIDGVTIAIEESTGTRVKREAAVDGVRAIALQRDRRRQERDEARHRLQRQSDAVRAWKDEADRLAQLGVENRKLVQAAIAQRDEWIRRARAAETRTERLSAEAELRETEEVLDALYASGF